MYQTDNLLFRGQSGPLSLVIYIFQNKNLLIKTRPDNSVTMTEITDKLSPQATLIRRPLPLDSRNALNYLHHSAPIFFAHLNFRLLFQVDDLMVTLTTLNF